MFQGVENGQILLLMLSMLQMEETRLKSGIISIQTLRTGKNMGVGVYPLELLDIVV